MVTVTQTAAGRAAHRQSGELVGDLIFALCVDEAYSNLISAEIEE